MSIENNKDTEKSSLALLEMFFNFASYVPISEKSDQK